VYGDRLAARALRQTRGVLGERERRLRRVNRDQRLGQLVLAGDDLAPVALELPGLAARRTKRLALVDERRDFALETLDAGIRFRHDSTYDV